MKVIITIKLHFFYGCGIFYPIGFFENEPSKINNFWGGKEPKGRFFAPDNYGQTSHSALNAWRTNPKGRLRGGYPLTRILIFFNPQHSWSGLKKIPRPQVHVFKPIHWTPLGKKLNLALPFTIKNWARLFYITGWKNSGSSVHKFSHSERIQKFPLWRVADSYAGRIHRIRVDRNRIRKKKKVAD